MKLLSIVILLIVCASPPLFAEEKENKEFLDVIVKEGKNTCNKLKGVEVLNCWADLTPERCKSFVYEQNWKTWGTCVYACGSTSFYDRTFGECSD